MCATGNTCWLCRLFKLFRLRRQSRLHRQLRSWCSLRTYRPFKTCSPARPCPLIWSCTLVICTMQYKVHALPRRPPLGVALCVQTRSCRPCYWWLESRPANCKYEESQSKVLCGIILATCLHTNLSIVLLRTLARYPCTSEWTLLDFSILTTLILSHDVVTLVIISDGIMWMQLLKSLCRTFPMLLFQTIFIYLWLICFAPKVEEFLVVVKPCIVVAIISCLHCLYLVGEEATHDEGIWFVSEMKLCVASTSCLCWLCRRHNLSPYKRSILYSVMWKVSCSITTSVL